ncbi:ead/Ea22-like family protein [Enterobacter hormaechei]|uniref:ead/Ea22-like family protein n=1 Tax=Enterobacter hormaechei TaxID=158836 RepID=UPI000F83C417|nr:ead/Ea22-like family protein [Enterobacter hormaechei]RTP42020.1 ead/Ea22-like family protein [Enterobacter hormaechei]
MSNIDKLMEKLKSAALKLNCEQWQTRNGFSGVEVIVKGSVVKGHGCVSYQPVASELVDTKTAKAIALFCPANILALLDELEAKDKSIGFLKDQLAQLANFNPDWDKLEAATDSLREHMAKLSSAEKRIAELEAPAPELKMAHLINKFYERYPLAEFKSDTERSAALGYFMAGTELQCFGEFINYAELMGDE